MAESKSSRRFGIVVDTSALLQVSLAKQDFPLMGIWLSPEILWIRQDFPACIEVGLIHPRKSFSLYEIGRSEDVILMRRWLKERSLNEAILLIVNQVDRSDEKGGWRCVPLLFSIDGDAFFEGQLDIYSEPLSGPPDLPLVHERLGWTNSPQSLAQQQEVSPSLTITANELDNRAEEEKSDKPLSQPLKNIRENNNSFDSMTGKNRRKPPPLPSKRPTHHAMMRAAAKPIPNTALTPVKNNDSQESPHNRNDTKTEISNRRPSSIRERIQQFETSLPETTVSKNEYSAKTGTFSFIEEERQSRSSAKSTNGSSMHKPSLDDLTASTSVSQLSPNLSLSNGTLSRVSSALVDQSTNEEIGRQPEPNRLSHNSRLPSTPLSHSGSHSQTNEPRRNSVEQTRGKKIHFAYLRKQDRMGFWVSRLVVFDSRQRTLIHAGFDIRTGALLPPEHIAFHHIKRVQLSVYSSRQFDIDEDVSSRMDLGTKPELHSIITHRFLCDDDEDAQEWIGLIHSISEQLQDLDPPPERPIKKPNFPSTFTPDTTSSSLADSATLYKHSRNEKLPFVKTYAPSLPQQSYPYASATRKRNFPVDQSTISTKKKGPLHSFVHSGKKIPPPPPPLPEVIGKRNVYENEMNAQSVNTNQISPPTPPALHPRGSPQIMSSTSLLNGKTPPPPPPLQSPASLATAGSAKVSSLIDKFEHGSRDSESPQMRKTSLTARTPPSHNTTVSLTSPPPRPPSSPGNMSGNAFMNSSLSESEIPAGVPSSAQNKVPPPPPSLPLTFSVAHVSVTPHQSGDVAMSSAITTPPSILETTPPQNVSPPSSLIPTGENNSPLRKIPPPPPLLPPSQSKSPTIRAAVKVPPPPPPLPLFHSSPEIKVPPPPPPPISQISSKQIPPPPPLPMLSSNLRNSKSRPARSRSHTSFNLEMLETIHNNQVETFATSNRGDDLPVWLLPRSSRPREAPPPPPRTTPPGYYHHQNRKSSSFG